MSEYREYFFDTFAVIEILRKNAAYLPYAAARMHLTKLNLYELCLYALRIEGEASARRLLEQCSPFVDEIDDEVVFAAARLKHENKALSMADCVGYVTARRLGVKFLTGDKEFKKMKNVEWVS